VITNIEGIRTTGVEICYGLDDLAGIFRRSQILDDAMPCGRIVQSHAKAKELSGFELGLFVLKGDIIGVRRSKVGIAGNWILGVTDIGKRRQLLQPGQTGLAAII
jgi:hypothetical protein